MSRFYLPAFSSRVAAILLIVFGLTVVVIHAQPQVIIESQKPFTRDGCRAACFAGIQPGVTSIEDALVKLQASGWVKDIDNRTVNNVSGFISWGWSDQKPSWISGQVDGQIWATQKQVNQILIYGDVQLGSTRLMLGIPDQEEIDRSIDPNGENSLYTAIYAKAGLFIQSWQPCNPLEPLRRPIIVTYTLPADPETLPAIDSLAELRHTCAYSRASRPQR